MNWLDRHLWALPPIIAALLGAAGTVMHHTRPKWLPDLFTQDGDATLETFYVTLSGLLGTLLGFALTIVAILLALHPPSSRHIERARRGTMNLFFSLSPLVLTALILSMSGILFDTSGEAHIGLRLWLGAVVTACVAGISVGGLAFWLAALEVNRKNRRT